jgi:hypothetical protein
MDDVLLFARLDHSLRSCRMPRGVPSPRAALSDILLKKDFGHHAFVLMAQQMTADERYAPDDGIGEVHHEIDTRSD